MNFEQLPEPCTVGYARVAGIDFNRARTWQAARAVLALAVTPHGFTASQMADHVRRQTSSSPQDYGPRQAEYDLKKFRGKKLVRLVGNTRRYEASPYGLRMMSGLMLLREKVLGPLLGAQLSTETRPQASNPSELDQRYQVIRQHLHEVFRELGLAA